MDFIDDPKQIEIGQTVTGKIDVGGEDVLITRTGENEVRIVRQQGFYSTLDRVRGFYQADVRSQSGGVKFPCTCEQESNHLGPNHGFDCPCYTPY